jgi:hypothetical protein
MVHNKHAGAHTRWRRARRTLNGRLAEAAAVPAPVVGAEEAHEDHDAVSARAGNQPDWPVENARAKR